MSWSAARYLSASQAQTELSLITPKRSCSWQRYAKTHTVPLLEA